ncbi:MAG: hypothetical protein RBR08_15220 [Desulforegulaceae bacterium]|nr:hypothetical protein [Desulforegulaceae bacterium]
MGNSPVQTSTLEEDMKIAMQRLQELRSGRSTSIRLDEVEIFLFPKESKEKIFNFLKAGLEKIIENNTPHKWVPVEHPFDSSGEVRPFSKPEEIEKEIKMLLKEKNQCGWFEDNLEFLLSHIHIKQSVPTYQPGCGLRWISYFDLLWDFFNDWINEKFGFFQDEEWEEIDEKAEIGAQAIFQDFLKQDYSYFLKQIKKTAKL